MKASQLFPIAALQEELSQLKTEYAEATADRKARLKARIDILDAALRRTVDEAKQRSAQVKVETHAKLNALKNKAYTTRGEIRSSETMQHLGRSLNTFWRNS